MTHSLDVCVRGSGIVGRTLALMLARERLRVGLVAAPAAAAHHTDVRAYALNAASRALLESVRVWPDECEATPVRRMCVSSESATTVQFSADDMGVSALTWMVDVPALETRLQQAVQFQPWIESLPSAQNAPLTVVCEGKASLSRIEFGVTLTQKAYAQTAVAARLRCERPHAQVAYQWFKNGEILAFLPLGGAQGNSVAVVWSVHPDRASALLELDAQAFAHALQEASEATLGSLELISERAAWPLVMAQAQRWVGLLGTGPGARAWALAGDAAHAVHPLAGQGLNLGLADVAELTTVLRQREYWRSLSDLKLLRRYERARKVAQTAMGGVMDGLQQVFTREDTALQTLRDWGMKGFERSGPVKRWVAQRAMGLV